MVVMVDTQIGYQMYGYLVFSIRQFSVSFFLCIIAQALGVDSHAWICTHTLCNYSQASSSDDHSWKELTHLIPETVQRADPSKSLCIHIQHDDERV